jgi:hypothetical protein
MRGTEVTWGSSLADEALLPTWAGDGLRDESSVQRDGCAAGRPQKTMVCPTGVRGDSVLRGGKL